MIWGGCTWDRVKVKCKKKSNRGVRGPAVLYWTKTADTAARTVDFCILLVSRHNSDNSSQLRNETLIDMHTSSN